MHRLKSCFLTFIIVCALINVPAAAFAVSATLPDEQKNVDPVTMLVDLTLARPLGLVSTLAGLTIFLVASPLSALGGNTDETWSILVAAPANYTFQRPIGHFEP